MLEAFMATCTFIVIWKSQGVTGMSGTLENFLGYVTYCFLECVQSSIYLCSDIMLSSIQWYQSVLGHPGSHEFYPGLQWFNYLSALSRVRDRKGFKDKYRISESI